MAAHMARQNRSQPRPWDRVEAIKLDVDDNLLLDFCAQHDPILYQQRL